MKNIDRWRANPVEFIEKVIVNPETGKPFELLPAQRAFFVHAWQRDATGRLIYPEQVFGAPKKSAKTGTAAIHQLTTLVLFGERYGEGYCIANDLEQAQSRVFEMIKRIVESSPLLQSESRVTANRITFTTTGATIQALASDYTGAAGGHPTISSFDELWGYTSERSRRLWEEMVPVPTRKVSCRLTTTYAGFEGESELLHSLYKRGLQQPLVGKDLHAGDGILMFWSHVPIAPWQTEAWQTEMRRSLRPAQYLRMIENRFVTTESTFIDMDWWDACVDPKLTSQIADRSLSIWVGVDASVKHDSTAIVAVTWDKVNQKVRLVAHKIFQPSPDVPLDFEMAVEHTLLALHQRFNLRQALYDPYQMQASAQRLKREGIRIEEFAQSVPNLTEASQNLYELVKDRNLAVYPDDAMRLAMSRAVAVETSRGWRIAKEKQAHKIDVVVALGMASLAAVKAQGEYSYDTSFRWVSDGPPPPEPVEEVARRRKALYDALLRGERIPF
jgi:phage terminase large subunit-like protein